jgi:CTD small phosphatase-like protein 2
LDETLVHSSFLPFRKDINSNEIIDPDIHLKIYFDKKYYDVYVLTRPYIYEFLNDMSKIFIIYIFTASVKEYANPLLNEIDKNNIITKRLYRDSCTLTSDGKYVKNLNILNYNLKDVILVDNNPISYSYNKANGVPIKSWHNDKNDKELLKMRNFLNFLSSVDDVRYYISKVVENEEISFYKVNTMIAKEISINTKNNSVNNITPHKKINFNKIENIYKNLFSLTETSNNYSGSINNREPHPKNFCKKFIKNYKYNSPFLVNSHLKRNNLKLNINSINFNSDVRKSYKKKFIKTNIKNDFNFSTKRYRNDNIENYRLSANKYQK